ncbi:MAG: hypothetical protein DI562_20010 [Stenotrophomonas acidaminiphila]|nr:MAG: hypothetical protein DI562_20010 [Stenotrophomonas acidaminiphila]
MGNRQRRKRAGFNGSIGTQRSDCDDSLLPIPDSLAVLRPTKKRHEGAYGMQCLGQYQIQAVVVLMSHARPALPRATS